MPACDSAARTALLALLLAGSLPAVAAAEPYTPPKGKVWNGLTAGFDVGDFQSRAGKHPAIWQHFIAWGQNYQYTLTNSRNASARLMYHLSTSKGQNLPERFSPGEIARGEGDGYLIQLTRSMAEHGRADLHAPDGRDEQLQQPVRGVQTAAARRRDADHSARTFIKAWKRVHVIMHGGDVAAINARLAALRLPDVQASAATLPAAADRVRVGADDRRRAEHPRAAPAGLLARPQLGRLGGHELLLPLPELHRARPLLPGLRLGKRKPFAIAEWAIWGSDAPGFADRLFDWIADHQQVKMVHYNQGGESDGIFRLRHYPGSARVIRNRLSSAALPRVRARAALGLEGRGDHAPVGRRGGRDPLAARLGQRREDAAAVVRAHRAAGQALVLEPGHDARARALREVHALRELLHPHLALRALAEPRRAPRTRPPRGRARA